LQKKMSLCKFGVKKEEKVEIRIENFNKD